MNTVGSAVLASTKLSPTKFIDGGGVLLAGAVSAFGQGHLELSNCASVNNLRTGRSVLVSTSGMLTQ